MKIERVMWHAGSTSEVRKIVPAGVTGVIDAEERPGRAWVTEPG